LPTKHLNHPEARRATELPFVFEVGRLTVNGQVKTVREVELVTLAWLNQLAQEAALGRFLADYAHFVVEIAATRHARLTGQSLQAFLTTRTKG
jgi:acetyl-CoA acetyltransferase